MNLRKTSFAGNWYPRSASECKAQIEHFLSQGPARNLTSRSWLGGIVPHSGWYFSGSLACSVIHLLEDEPAPDIVVIFGMHLHPGSSNYMMAEGAWETPLGHLPVAGALAAELQRQFDFQLETSERFIPDNTIEVQLPFVKYLLDPAEVLALGVPPNIGSADIGRAVAKWAHLNNKRMKIIGSTDLTHYGRDYNFASHGEGPAAVEWVRRQNDRRVIDAMLNMSPEQVLREGLQNRNACCVGAVAAALAAVRQLGATQAQLVEYATSYDKSPGDSFVGYAGIVFGV